MRIRLTDAEVAKAWWVAEPWEFTGLVLEAKPGGRFEFNIRNKEDGAAYSTHGEYQEVVHNEKLVWTNADLAAPLLGSTGGTIDSPGWIEFDVTDALDGEGF